MIDIICPIYNGEKYIENLNNSLITQKNVRINKILYILTESIDNSEKILKDNNLNYVKIKKDDFSHSLIREKYALLSSADIVTFISQDIIIEDKNWLYKLTKNLGKNNIAYSYSRQISKYNNIEKYIRNFNYPNRSIIKSKENLKELGLNTFFCSDASSAVLTQVFKELKGYDNKNLPISEDMYFAYKTIMNGYSIIYESDSIVYHSHKLSLRQLFGRYKLTGKFFKDNSYLEKYNINNSGKKLAFYVLKEIIKERRIKLLFRYPFDMASRLIGMKVGKI